MDSAVQGPAGVGDDLFLARHQRDLFRSLQRDDAVIDLAREQAEESR
jgi:hypothetical protein